MLHKFLVASRVTRRCNIFLIKKDPISLAKANLSLCSGKGSLLKNSRVSLWQQRGCIDHQKCCWWHQRRIYNETKRKTALYSAELWSSPVRFGLSRPPVTLSYPTVSFTDLILSDNHGAWVLCVMVLFNQGACLSMTDCKVVPKHLKRSARCLGVLSNNTELRRLFLNLERLINLIFRNHISLVEYPDF